MKHSQQVLIFFIALFLITQVIGLLVISLDSETIIKIDSETQEEITEIVFYNTSVGERPDINEKETILTMIIGIFFGTIILLLLSKLKKVNIWKHWFFLASIITISITLGVLFNIVLTWIVAIILSAWKIYKPNFLIHNFTEILIYPGIALLLVPLLNVFYAFILLIIISIYDAYAVWKSKHMITMAKFAKDANLFPGLAVNYDSSSGKLKNKKETIKTEKITSKKQNNKINSKIRTGILGGGDIAFPLIFASSFLVFMLEQGFSNISAFFYSLIICLFAGVSLMLLFLYGKKDSYYPAMPFISAGCFIGYLFVMLLLRI